MNFASKKSANLKFKTYFYVLIFDPGCSGTFLELPFLFLGFPGGSEVKVSASNVGDPALIPGSGRSPGEGNGNPLQCSCLENPMDGEAW